MESLQRCSVGVKHQVECSKEKHFKRRKAFNENEIYLLERRTNCPGFSNICRLHLKRYKYKYKFFEKICCNPFNAHKKKTKGLWTVSKNCGLKCRESLPTVLEGKKLCATCKVKVLKVISIKAKDNDLNQGEAEEVVSHAVVIAAEKPENSSLTHDPGPSTSDLQIIESLQSHGYGSSSPSDTIELKETVYSPIKGFVDKINTSLSALGQSPIKTKKRMRSRKYVKKKLNKTNLVFRKSFQKILEDNIGNPMLSDEDFDLEGAGQDIMKQLKESFQKTKQMSRKIMILSLSPKSWSKQQIMSYFGATKYMVEKMKDCVKEKGILCTPDPGKGKILPDHLRDLVVGFYREPQISRELPGAKEYKSVLEDGKRVQKQKRLVLGTLKEIYEAFKTTHPNKNIGFSKFCQLRPAECVLAGASGTHSVCVCQTHQNFKLMFMGARLNQLKLPEEDSPFHNYRDILLSTICESQSNDCYRGTCKKCPGDEKLEKILRCQLESNYIDDITYYQWQQTDRCSLEKITASADEFIEKLLSNIPNVRKHDFVAKKQSDFFKRVRDNLPHDEVLVIADFSENYHFIIQDSVQGVHWDNTQATVHPFACYFRDAEGEVKPLSLVIISDSLEHSTTSVHAFQRVLISFLIKKNPSLKKVIYFSDGASSQYKNRYNVTNVLFHEDDFGIPAEWHYYATSHGKGPSDGLGGTLKRNASRASLQRPEDKQIKTPKDLFDWATSKENKMNFAFVSTDDIKSEGKAVAARFRGACEVKGIRQYHAAIPVSSQIICMKYISEESTGINIQMRNSNANADNFEPINTYSTRMSSKKGLTDEELAKILANLSESEDGLDFSDTDSVADLPYLPSDDEDDARTASPIIFANEEDEIESESVLEFDQPSTSTATQDTLPKSKSQKGKGKSKQKKEKVKWNHVGIKLNEEQLTFHGSTDLPSAILNL
ncbi:unnamed protein product [Brassicogethes aeneus]|uniref:Uncharacterized protein n=1 Tax=Brassicogethes aeneus TaxID=1431903 RepID=A0A9P0FEE8_BRAAE|nr:unnamed protein product [Brassicogethes aeneus]